MVKLILISMLWLVGCAGVQHLGPEKAIGGGVATGVVAGEVAKKVKDVFTPKYRIDISISFTMIFHPLWLLCLRLYPARLSEP